MINIQWAAKFQNIIDRIFSVLPLVNLYVTAARCHLKLIIGVCFYIIRKMNSKYILIGVKKISPITMTSDIGFYNKQDKIYI